MFDAHTHINIHHCQVINSKMYYMGLLTVAMATMEVGSIYVSPEVMVICIEKKNLN